jgi:hypothetical protein
MARNQAEDVKGTARCAAAILEGARMCSLASLASCARAAGRKRKRKRGAQASAKRAAAATRRGTLTCT